MARQVDDEGMSDRRRDAFVGVQLHQIEQVVRVLAVQPPCETAEHLAGTARVRQTAGCCDIILVSKHQCETDMSRLTITLSEARYRALKEASAQRDKTIGQLIDESLDFYGIKSREDARGLVRRARAHSKLSDDQAMAVAQDQVRAVRRKKS